MAYSTRLRRVRSSNKGASRHQNEPVPATQPPPPLLELPESGVVTLIVLTWLAVSVLLSVTVTVNVYEPNAVGTPLSTPVPVFSASPGGRSMAGMLHVYPPAPPPAVNVTL